MKNKLFKGILWLFFVITILFLTVPLALLIIRGTGYISVCIFSSEVLFAIGLSMKTTIISTVICLLFAIPTALYFYNYNFRFNRFIMQLICLPMSLPHLVSGIALLLLFGNLGMGRWLLEWFSVDFVFTEMGIVLAQVFVNLPLTIKMIFTTMQETSGKMNFVARTLGCNEVQSFFYITLPTMKNGIASATVMTWSRALGEFGAVVMLAGATRMKTEVLPTAIFLNMSTGDIDKAMGIAVILIIISLTCMLIFEGLLKKGQSGEKIIDLRGKNA